MKKAGLITSLVAIGLILVGGAMVFVSLAATGFNIMNLVKTVDYEEESVFIAEDFSNLNLDMGSHSIELLKSEDDKARFIYYVSENEEFDVAVENDTLGIKSIDKADANWRKNLFVLDLNDHACKLYLPKDVYKNVKAEIGSGDLKSDLAVTFSEVNIHIGSGDVDLSNAQTEDLNIKTGSGDLMLGKLDAGNITLHSSSGDVILHTVTAHSASVEAGSGEISVNGAEIEEGLATKSSSGGIEYIGVKCGNADLRTGSGGIYAMAVSCDGDFEGQTSSGRINLEEVVSGGDLKARTGSGNIDLSLCDGANMDLKTSSGGVKGTVKSGKVFAATATSGSVKVPANDREGGDCIIHTGSGSIKIEIATELPEESAADSEE